MKIDIHTHVLPPEMPAFAERFGYGGFVRLNRVDACHAQMLRDDGSVFRNVTHNSWDATERLRECDLDGVDIQVLSTVPVLFSYWAKPEDGLEVARFLNDHIASLVRAHPKRFIGLATLPLQGPELAIRELERCVKELGLAGAQIGSHINDWNLDEPALFPVFEAAQEIGAALFVHPWDMMAKEKMPKYWLPWLIGMPAETTLAICSMIFGGVFERLPRLRVAFAHGGGSFPGTIGRIQHGFEVRPDLVAVDNAIAPRAYLGKFFVDSLVHDPTALRAILELFGKNRVALGSDYPFPLGERHAGALIASMTDLDSDTRARLLAGNALEWLGRASLSTGGAA